MRHTCYYVNYIALFLVLLATSCTKDNESDIDIIPNQNPKETVINTLEDSEGNLSSSIKSTLQTYYNQAEEEGVVAEGSDILSNLFSRNSGNDLTLVEQTGTNITVLASDANGMILEHNLESAVNPGVIYQEYGTGDFTFDKIIISNTSTNVVHLSVVGLVGIFVSPTLHTLQPGEILSLNLEEEWTYGNYVAGTEANSYIILGATPNSGNVKVYLYHDFY